MREVRDVRVILEGDTEVAAGYERRARNVLGDLKYQLELGNLDSGVRRERIEAHVHVTAIRRAEMDTVIIRAESEDGDEEPEEEYIPYLWVGARMISTSIPEDFTWAMPQVQLHVFEPPVREGEDRRAQFVSMRGNFAITYGMDVYPAGDQWTCYKAPPPNVSQFLVGGPPNCGALNHLPLADNAQFWADRGFLDTYLYGYERAVYTSHNLYLTGYPFSYDPKHKDDDDIDTLWEQTATLDPGDAEKTLKPAPGGFIAALPRVVGDVGADAGPDDWRLQGRVLAGKYVIKVCLQNAYECEIAPGVVEIEVRVGKQPGHTLTRRLTVPITNASNFFREIIPYGWYDWAHAHDPARGYGHNPHADNWWQGSIVVDVMNGTLKVIEEEDEDADEALLYLTDPGYALHNGRDMPFIKDVGHGVPPCGDGCTRMSPPYWGPNGSHVYIDYRDHPHWGHEQWIHVRGVNYYTPSGWPMIHFAFMRAIVTGVYPSGNVCQIQVWADCAEIGSNCEPLGAGSVWPARNIEADPGPFELGDVVFIVSPRAHNLGVASKQWYENNMASELFTKLNLICPTNSPGEGIRAGSHEATIHDIELAGYKVDCIDGIEVVTGYPGWHPAGQ